MGTGTQTYDIIKVGNDDVHYLQDDIAVEEPLEIRITQRKDDLHINQNITVTMRTPGYDFELAAGFLLSEGLVRERADIKNIDYCLNPGATHRQNTVFVELSERVSFDPAKFRRYVYTNSSCGICGRQSLEMVQKNCTCIPVGDFQITHDYLIRLLTALDNSQTIFAKTGGVHASALFDKKGECLIIREDVGRHNALDKVVGAMLLADKLPATNTVLLLSGRISFELVQKAVLAGIPIIAAIGAPSTLAVDIAQEFGITLIGFLGKQRFNVYAGKQRVAGLYVG
ncbi:formate dehydrogenase accessory sulfurtransferase FdhD [candidate division KSB1 bacterium]|nr:formate dehydrogenase accessory sulfurtransferase FdhD [candidate division KSB1 bacterium]